jgi:hypothetical protein
VIRDVLLGGPHRNLKIGNGGLPSEEPRASRFALARPMSFTTPRLALLDSRSTCSYLMICRPIRPVGWDGLPRVGPWRRALEGGFSFEERLTCNSRFA